MIWFYIAFFLKNEIFTYWAIKNTDEIGDSICLDSWLYLLINKENTYFIDLSVSDIIRLELNFFIWRATQKLKQHYELKYVRY